MSEIEDSTKKLTFSRKWMPVKRPENFNPNQVPTSGVEFLHYAMYEAKNCEAVKTANLDTSNFNKICSELSNTNFEVPESPQSLVPSREWQKEYVEQFTEYRNYIQSNLPPVSELKSYPQWIYKIDEEYPEFSVVSHYNAYTQKRKLVLIVKKMQRIPAGGTISHSLGVWLYSILSIIQIPMSPDMCDIVRKLARECKIIRSKLPADSKTETFSYLNMIVSIVGIYFKQFDVADHYP